ncbi:dUTP diphosphatase [Oceanobacillus jeddahense]|uniref:dUTP diphosphatase n=1 Tax=Oceanobacillus jeddahense TaxID=1462527 RepID=UPI00059633CB|nr:dUTP diphosphatase [Oceanobacillus jeddahense]
MNIQKLFEIQAKLDKHIVEKKGLEGRNLLDEKILALQVELGELANEWRGFKFWSENQEPKPPVHNWDVSEDGLTQEWLPEWGYESYPLLEEYVDCLHFILSIGLDYNVNPENSTKHINETMNWILEDRNVRSTSITEQFNIVFANISYFHQMGELEHYYDVTTEFFILGEKLGFTDKQIEQAYLDKNKINHERQQNGY